MTSKEKKPDVLPAAAPKDTVETRTEVTREVSPETKTAMETRSGKKKPKADTTVEQESQSTPADDNEKTVFEVVNAPIYHAISPMEVHQLTIDGKRISPGKSKKQQENTSTKETTTAKEAAKPDDDSEKAQRAQSVSTYLFVGGNPSAPTAAAAKPEDGSDNVPKAAVVSSYASVDNKCADAPKDNNKEKKKTPTAPGSKKSKKNKKQGRETFVPPGKPKKTANDPVTTNHLPAEPLKRTSRNVPKAAPQEPLLEKACLNFVRLARNAGLAAIKREWVEVAAHVPSNTSARCYASNETKNVLGGAPCLDATRVNLTFEVPPKEDYIHASWVTTTQCQLGVRLILAQAPQTNTVDDFWRMVWQEKAHSIVMLCGKYEGQSACPQYWPSAKDTLTYGSITVAHQENLTPENDATAYSKHGVTVTHADEQPHRAYFYVFYDWPEGGIPPDTTLQLLRVVRTVDAEGGTAVVHGAVGVGRPGVFAALAIALKTLKEGKVCSLPAIVKEIRSQRSGAVATEIQYLYIYAAICEYMRRKKIEPKAATHFYNKFMAYHKQYVKAGNRPVPVFDHTGPGGPNLATNMTTTQDIGRSPIGADQAPPRPLATQIAAAPNNPNRPPTSPAAGPSDRAVAIAPLVQGANPPQPPQDAKPRDDAGNPYW